MIRLSEDCLICILSHLCENDLRNVAKSSFVFQQIIKASPNLSRKFNLILDQNQLLKTTNQNDMIDIFYRNVTILHWRFLIENDAVLAQLNIYKNSIENITFKFSTFENISMLFGILKGHSQLKAIKFESCSITIKETDSNINNKSGFELPPNLKSVLFKDCSKNLYKSFQNQTSIEKITVISNKKTWNGFPHDQFNELVKTLPNLKYLKFDGPGTASYFDRNEFPFKVVELEAESITYHSYIENKSPRLGFLKSQLGSLKEFKLHQLPNGFDGDEVLKFIIKEMKLEKFYYRKIPLILNGQKQQVKNFLATESQIQAFLEMFRQFPGIESFTLAINKNESFLKNIDEVTSIIKRINIQEINLQKLTILEQDNDFEQSDFLLALINKFSTIKAIIYKFHDLPQFLMKKTSSDILEIIGHSILVTNLNIRLICEAIRNSSSRIHEAFFIKSIESSATNQINAIFEYIKDHVKKLHFIEVHVPTSHHNIFIQSIESLSVVEKFKLLKCAIFIHGRNLNDIPTLNGVRLIDSTNIALIPLFENLGFIKEVYEDGTVWLHRN